MTIRTIPSKCVHGVGDISLRIPDVIGSVAALNRVESSLSVVDVDSNGASNVAKNCVADCTMTVAKKSRVSALNTMQNVA